MWLGIDLGTSGVKSVIVDEDGAVLSQSTAALSVQRPNPLWSEQAPAAWWEATKASIICLPEKQRASVKGIGLSGQMHGAVLLDKTDVVLRPAILWNDGRSAPYCAALDPMARKFTGNLAMAGFTAPKLSWVRENEPEIFSATRKVLLPKDYLRLLLTGEKASEMSDASGTLWLDVAERRWSPEMLAATGMDERYMPALVEGAEVSGKLRRAVADELGLPVVPVAGGAGDQAAGAIGAGVTDPGQAFLSLGTSGVVFAASGGFEPAPENGVHAFCHALPDRWHAMTVMLSAAACLDWVTRLTGFTDVPSALEAAAYNDTPASKLPLFLPYLSGERTPHNNPSAKGVFFGMSQETGPAELVRSTLEGVGFGLRDGLDAMASKPDQLSVIGGGAQSEHWAQILADILVVPLIYRDGASVGPANGAARLARLAVTADSVADVCTQPPEQSRFCPKSNQDDRFAKFRSLYPALKSSFGEF
ncbi:xylulokinase [Erythrobacter crassostreae]|uniref:Xylulose kinase n=1 Tax=Erythrobacter crassostreae TaxID=2828328 RepID=A0A9X1JMT3_9SPHN|nr:xylulokinase [Erythrobacter crassostrea]MBV7259058.1 xylulokinase [Erythrobacter crassostrea]